MLSIMTNSPNDAVTLRAIEVMTAWTDSEGGGGTTFAQSRIEQIFDNEGPEGLFDLMTGLANLAGKLLLLREKENKIPPGDTLQAIALSVQSRDT
jgi:hypothetical protein